MEYPFDPDVAEFGFGSVWVTAVGSHSGQVVPVELGPVGSGCYTCQVPAAPVALAMQGDVIAWNYPAYWTDAIQPTLASGFGYAVVTDVKECPEGL